MPDQALGKATFGRQQRPPGIPVAQVRILRREQSGNSQLLTALGDAGSGDDRATDLWEQTIDVDPSGGALMSLLERSQLPIVRRSNRPRWYERESCDG